MADSPPPEPGLPRPLPPQTAAERIRLLFDEWRDRIPWAALVVVAAVAFGFTWWLTRPAPVAPVRPDDALPMAAPLPTPTPVPQTLVVHVAGAVESPGVFTVVSDARVIEVVEQAGGLAADADLTRVNLAGVVGDGERIWIPRLGEDAPPVDVGQAVGAGPSASEEPGAGPVDLNEATAAELETLPGVGPTTAAAIVDHRDRNGPFVAVDDLLEVSGIGPAKLEAIRPAATV